MSLSAFDDLLAQTKALADATRLRLVALLAGHELSVGEAVAVLGMGQSRVSRHLKILVDAGILWCTRSGAWALYRVPDPVPPIVVPVLAALTQDPQIQADRDRATAVLVERRRSSVRFFDALAGEWKALSQEVLGDVDLDALVMEHLDGVQTVVDLGCGPGFLVERLAASGRAVVGVDHSPRMLEAAARRTQGLAGVSLRLGDLEHLPVRDGEADAAVLSLVLHHLPRPQAVLLEAARAVSAGGRLIIADYASHGEERLRRRHGDHWLGFSPDVLEAWVVEAGFHVVLTRTYPLPSRLGLILLVAQRPQGADSVSPKEES